MKPKFSDLTPEQQNTFGNGCGLYSRWLRVPQFVYTASCRQHDFGYVRSAPTPSRWVNIVSNKLSFLDDNKLEHWIKRKILKIVWCAECINNNIQAKTKADMDFFRAMLIDASNSDRPIFYSIMSYVYLLGVSIFGVFAFHWSTRYRTLEEILAYDALKKSIDR